MKTLDLIFIKKQRLILKKTLKDMAESLDMKNPSTYLKYETGAYCFRAEHLPRLAEALDCEISDFFTSDVAKTAI
ncbi:helix-turn-helix domain-containing protein [Viridibacillus arvi]|uniref:helix-turn-helix domain-containing protein n=1 Tax=Viridibacillus arvi TaxID=263475 RepID=UPI00187BBA7C|nr:helix-turn-helix transcriptional regulator [Viridibacillus sp. JNUCC-6]QOV10906.1 helix-turn-helix transcriptional regulator [Viridibacillus sp. JNUCC-6]